LPKAEPSIVVGVDHGMDSPPTVSNNGADDVDFKSAEPLAGPAFLVAYFKRRDEQLQDEERLYAEVLQIPVSDHEVREIQIELRRSINETFETNDVST